MAKIGKRTTKAREGIDVQKQYPLDEAVKLIKARAKAKFDETIEVAMNLGVDPRHADQMVRGVVSLPNGSGRTARVAVFAKGAKADEARKAGADIVGAEDLAEQVQKGEINFDRCIATPDMMGVVGRVTRQQLREIAEVKMKDLNANDIEAAARIIEGSARAMGLEVTGN